MVFSLETCVGTDAQADGVVPRNRGERLSVRAHRTSQVLVEAPAARNELARIQDRGRDFPDVPQDVLDVEWTRGGRVTADFIGTIGTVLSSVGHVEVRLVASRGMPARKIARVRSSRDPLPFAFGTQTRAGHAP